MASPKTSSKLNIYHSLEQALKEVSEGWTENIELDAEPGTRSIHLLVARAALLQTFKLMDSVPGRWRWGVSDEGIAKMGKPTEAPYAGYRVITLYAYHAALAAGYQGLNKAEIQRALSNPLSYEPIRGITDLSNKVALPIERAHGLNHTRICDDGLFLVRQNRYAIENGVVVMPRLEHEIILASRDVLDEEVGEDSMPAEIARVLHGKDCLAEKAGVLKDIHRHLVTICIKDTRLAVASLRRGRTSESVPSTLARPIRNVPLEVYSASGLN